MGRAWGRATGQLCRAAGSLVCRIARCVGFVRPAKHLSGENRGVSSAAGSKFCALLQRCVPNVYYRGMFIIPHGAPAGYEWVVALVVLVGLYFAVRNLMRARR